MDMEFKENANFKKLNKCQYLLRMIKVKNKKLHDELKELLDAASLQEVPKVMDRIVEEYRKIS